MTEAQALARIKKSKKVHETHKDSDGCWVFLDGYCWDDQGLHGIHEDTWVKCYEELQTVVKCKCPDCE